MLSHIIVFTSAGTNAMAWTANSIQTETPLKLVDKFTYLGSSVSSTEKDIDTRLTKAWTALDRLSIIWKSDLTDKMKRSFFQATVVSILLYGCTTWTLTKRLEKKLDANFVNNYSLKWRFLQMISTWSNCFRYSFLILIIIFQHCC